MVVHSRYLLERGWPDLIKNVDVTTCTLSIVSGDVELYSDPGKLIHWVKTRSGENIFFMDDVDDHVIWVGDEEDLKAVARHLLASYTPTPEELEEKANLLLAEARRAEERAREIEARFEEHVRAALEGRGVCSWVVEGGEREEDERRVRECLEAEVRGYRLEARRYVEQSAQLTERVRVLREAAAARSGVEGVLVCDGGLQHRFAIPLKP